MEDVIKNVKINHIYHQTSVELVCVLLYITIKSMKS